MRLLEKFIIVSPIIAPRPQNHSPFKSLFISIKSLSLYIDTYRYMYVSQFCGCTAGRNVQPIAIKFGTKFSLDVNKNGLVRHQGGGNGGGLKS